MKRNVHRSGQDRRCKYDQKTSQDNDSLDDMNYNLETQKKWSDSLTYKPYMVEETESIDIEKYAGKYNQVVDETDIQTKICFVRTMSAYD